MPELSVKASLLAEFRAMPVLPKLAPNCSRKKIGTALEVIELGLESRIQLVNSRKDLTSTSLRQWFVALALDNIECLRKHSTGAPSCANLIELVNFLSAKISFEFAWGIKLSGEPAGFRTSGASWDEASILLLGGALNALPEGLALNISRLNEFQRVATLGELVLGQHFPDGRIKIADFAIDNRYLESCHRGIASLISTLVHEIGHAVRLEQGDSGGGDEAVGADAQSQGEIDYEPSEIMRIYGWRLIDPTRWQWTEDGGNLQIVLDGIQRPIGVPFKINEKAITITIDAGRAYYHEIYTPLSLVTYSRANRWEHWADAFKEYCLLPDRLIQMAPEKFNFLEQEFRKYSNNSELMELARKESHIRWSTPRGRQKDAA